MSSPPPPPAAPAPEAAREAAPPPPRGALLTVATVALGVFLALLVLVLLGLSDGPDGRLLRRARLDPDSEGLEVARVVTDVGSGGALSLWLPVLALILLAWRRTGLRLVVAPVAAIGVTSALVNATKVAVGRDRPPAAGRLVETHTLSFPSGHSASAAAGLLTFALVATALLRSRAGRVSVLALAVAGAAAVGWTRSALAVHWPADIVGGWALGTAVACLTVLVAEELGRRPRRVRRAGRPGPRGP